MKRWAGIILVAWMVLGAPLTLAAQALPGQGLPDFIALVQRHGAAVVNISTTQAPRTPGVQGNVPLHPLGNWLRRFLQEPEREPGFSLESRSLGSGFIISADGYLLTNAHVIEDADEIIVRLVDRREFRARVVGVDRPSDVALIHIDATDLPVVRIGKPERAQVGEWVLAIGSPFGFEHSVTAGIISALGRTLPDESFVPFIQTDVAINPGNSGGPLFNLQGEVIGINSQIYSQTGGFMGLSFAIPIDVALAVQERLRAGKMVERGRIGVVVQEVTRALADSFGLPGTHGALIAMVEDGSPAERGGLRQGDAIVRFAGKAVEASNDLPRIVAAHAPGETVEVQVYREGLSHNATLTLGEWPSEETPQGTAETEAGTPPARLDIEVREPDAIKPGVPRTGVLVVRIGGTALAANLRVGDVLLARVRGGKHQRFDSVEDFRRMVEGLAADEVVTLLVRRSGFSSYVTLRAGS